MPNIRLLMVFWSARRWYALVVTPLMLALALTMVSATAEAHSLSPNQQIVQATALVSKSARRGSLGGVAT